MNKQITFAFLLAISGTAFAAETEAMTTEQTTVEQQNVNSISIENSTEDAKSTTQKIKNGLHKYLIRKDKKRTALNITAKMSALVGVSFLCFMDIANLNNLNFIRIDTDFMKEFKGNNKNHTKTFLALSQLFKIAGIRELTNY